MCEYSVLSTRPASIARYKQEKQVHSFGLVHQHAPRLFMDWAVLSWPSATEISTARCVETGVNYDRNEDKNSMECVRRRSLAQNSATQNRIRRSGTDRHSNRHQNHCLWKRPIKIQHDPLVFQLTQMFVTSSKNKTNTNTLLRERSLREAKCSIAIPQNHKEKRNPDTKSKHIKCSFFDEILGLKLQTISISTCKSTWLVDLFPRLPPPTKKKKIEMLGSIVLCLASPRKILGENFFEHSG